MNTWREVIIDRLKVMLVVGIGVALFTWILIETSGCSFPGCG